MGDDGSPQGVSTFNDAASVKPGSDWMPVPPMTAMRTGSVGGQDASWAREHGGCAPSYEEATPAILRSGLQMEALERAWCGTEAATWTTTATMQRGAAFTHARPRRCLPASFFFLGARSTRQRGISSEALP